MRIAANEGNVRHMAARNRHPDGAALGTAFGFMRKNVNNTKRLNPDSPLKQAVNRLGKIRKTRVSRQMKEMVGHIAARIRHPDGAVEGSMFRFMRKNVSNNRRLNPIRLCLRARSKETGFSPLVC